MDDITALCKRHGVDTIKFGFFWGDEAVEVRQAVASTKRSK